MKTDSMLETTENSDKDAVYVFPTSFAQQRLWFFDQLSPGSDAYNLPAAVRLHGNPDLSALERSLNKVIERHETLRTTFRVVNGEPRQVVSPARRVSIPLADLSLLDPRLRERETMRLVSQEARRGFDLERGPLFRFMLVGQGEGEYALLLTMHHIVSDGWSMRILAKEISLLYSAYSRGLPSPLPDLPIQYADYAVWQREWLQGEVLASDLAYWKKRLEGAPAVMSLPCDKPRGESANNRAAVVHLALDRELSDRLRQICREENATMYMLLLAAYAALLARHSDADDIVVGSPVAGRERVETEGLIGFFVNTLALRIGISEREDFRSLLRHVREVALDAHAHQRLPFEKLVEELQPERSLHYSPIFQALFQLNNMWSLEEEDELKMFGKSVKSTASGIGTGRAAKFDLYLFLTEAGGKIRGGLEYNTGLFDRRTILNLAEHYCELLKAIASDPGQPVSALRMARDDERRRLIKEWNATERAYPSEKSINELFEEQAVLTPHRIALRYERRQISYAELNARAERLAERLIQCGMKDETVVAVFIERSVEMVIALLGTLKAGAAYLPLDPAYPDERIRFMLEDAGAAIVLTQSGLAERVLNWRMKALILDGEPEEPGVRAGRNPRTGGGGDRLAYVMYTSGSTGYPKGVRVVHRGVVRLVKDSDYVEFDGTFLQLAPISFDASTFEIWGPLLNGGELVIMPAGGQTLEAIAESIRRNQITTLWLTASLFQEMVDFHLDSLQEPRDLLAGGDTLPVKQTRKVIDRLGHRKLVNGYGPTENTTFTCCHVMTCETSLHGSVPIGRPIANTQVYLLDQRLEPSPVGITGEIYTGGDGLARDYLNRPSLTAANFVPDPFSGRSGARLYRTGDLARYRPNGEIEFLGRTDHQVKIMGRRVEMGEVEAALMSCEGVRQAAVIPRKTQNGDMLLAAYVIGEGIQIADLIARLRERLPEYMVPGAFALLDQAPLTPNGKIDRKALAGIAVSLPEPVDESIPPRDLLEFSVMKIWEEVLNVRPFGIRRNFFSLGGHSLSAARLMARIKKSFQRELPLSSLFEDGTVERQASLLRRQPAPPSSSPVVKIKTSGALPPFFCVHPIGGNVLCYSALAQCIEDDRPFFGLQAMAWGEGAPTSGGLKETAAGYLKAILEEQPRGPYYLGGWSLGAALAFEIAQQLHAQNQRVAFLALLDSWAPLEENKPWRLVRDEASLLATLARSHRIELTRAAAAECVASDELLEGALEQAKKNDLIPSDVGPEWIRSLLQRHKQSVMDVLLYEPKIYTGPITLFRAKRRVSEGAAPDDWGWGRLCDRPVKIYAVQGDHYSMLEAPYVQNLAALLNDCLKSAVDG